MWSFATGSFDFAQCVKSSPMLLCASALHSFEWLNHSHCLQVPHSVYLFLHLWVFDCFYGLGIENNAAMDIHVHVSVWTYVFPSLGCMTRNGIAGSYSVFNHLKNPSTMLTAFLAWPGLAWAGINSVDSASWRTGT